MTEQHGSDQPTSRGSSGDGTPPRPAHQPGESFTQPIPRPEDTQSYGQQSGDRPALGQEGYDRYGQQDQSAWGQHDGGPYGQTTGDDRYGQGQYGQYSSNDQYGQQYGQYGSNDQYGQYPAGDQYDQHGQHDGSGAAWGGAAGTTATATRPASRRRRFGAGTLIACTLAAGLVGGGAAAGVTAMANGGSTADTSSTSQQGGTNTVIVNNQKSVNAISAAAQKASPSVATISVSGGGSSGTGSGIILDNDGHILTNTHVVTLDGQVSKPTIQVQLNDGRILSGSVVGTDPLSDLAIVKVSAPNLTPAEMGSSSSLNVGDTAIAIGSPLGLANTVTDGIVSTLNRTIAVQSSAVPKDNSGDSGSQNGQSQSPWNFAPPGGGQSQQSSSQGNVYLNVIQTDAAINPGNSGGALVDQNGKIIGVNVAIASSGSSQSGSSTGNIGVGFSIPIDNAKRVADEIIKNGKATHGQLGATVQSYAPGSSSSSSSAFSNGAQLQSIVSGGAAEKAGLQKGDVVTKVGNRTVQDSQELTAAVREQAAGASVKFEFTRNGKAQTANVTLGEATLQ
ncbi:trypsin-like peptidase domain-containing protein [Tersicoccus sp. MR15.9]|uniref:S1C family serine protease n=1 Tax=Tersicoccus mangrovi TaxID=3121635 RepID=UPI002FE5A832